MRTLRGHLREAMRCLRAPSGSVLCATYSSVDQSFCDVENVLIYNVGPSVFANSSGAGLRIVRAWMEPSVSPLGKLYRHHHRYCFINPPPKPNAPDATEFSFALTSLSTSTKPHEIWWHATSAGKTSLVPITGRYALYVELGSPAPFPNIANIVKPLLDGVICAMHAENQIDAEAVARLARASTWDLTEISNRLRGPPNPVLGSRRLVYPYRDFVKWDPADDRCDDCTVVVTPASALTCTVVVMPSVTEKSGGAFSVANAVASTQLAL